MRAYVRMNPSAAIRSSSSASFRFASSMSFPIASAFARTSLRISAGTFGHGFPLGTPSSLFAQRSASTRPPIQ